MAPTVSADGFDVIGDVHGHANRLHVLLEKLGYEARAGVFRHPQGRRVVFVGDLIDRGVGQIETLAIARAMVAAGTAKMVLGNHEVNAIAYATKRQDGAEYLRPHTPQHVEQHAQFIAAVGFDTAAHRDALDWFRSLPLWLELDGALRVVHACWDPSAVDGLGDPVLDTTTFHLAHDPGKATDQFGWVEHLCKGPEIELPEGQWFLDPSGHPRHHARVRWWNAEARTYGEVCELPVSAQECFTDEPWWNTPAPNDRAQTYTGEIPVIFGHYWRSPKSRADDLVHGRPVCVDVSCGRGGPLVAYRWSGERVADPANLVGVGDHWGGVTADRA